MPAATLSLRVRGLALYLGMIRRGRLEWVVSLGATCCERWRGKIRLLLLFFFYGVQMLRAGLLVTLLLPLEWSVGGWQSEERFVSWEQGARL